MAFFGIFLFMVPFFIAISVIGFSIIFFFGVCLLVIGITGIIMTKMHGKYINPGGVAVKHSYNAVSIILSILFMLFPFACLLYSFIAILLT